MNSAKLYSKSSWLSLALLTLALTGCGGNGKDGDTSSNTSTPGGTGSSPDAPGKDEARSISAFMKVHEVLTSPRCINCHPSGDRPSQGDKLQPHQPPVFRGAGGKGEVGMRCTTCHGAQNYTLLENAGSVPGVAGWHLAPLSMGWQGKSAGQICEQLKDTKRNGGKTLDQIIEHHANDAFIGWAWSPGVGRAPAPGTRETFVAFTREWVKYGAFCPTP